MSEMIEEEIKRWMARRKSALVLEIIQGKTTVAAASQPSIRSDPGRDRKLGRGWQTPDGERTAGQAGGCARAIRAPAQGPAGSVRRGHVGDPRPKKLASLLGKDES
nr:transposase [Stenotrophomonas ginsengisoli]